MEEKNLTAKEKSEIIVGSLVDFVDERANRQKKEMEDVLSLTESILTKVRKLPDEKVNELDRERWNNSKTDLEERYQRAVLTLEKEGSMSQETIDSISLAFYSAEDLQNRYL